MSYIPKTSTRITAVPPELCTRKELCAILGIKDTSGRAYRKNSRLRKLHYTPVILNGSSTYLYNRKEVESLKYPTPPASHVTTLEACHLLGYPHIKDSYGTSNIRRKLYNHGLIPISIRSTHTSLYWNKADILALKKKLKHPTRNTQQQ